MTEVAVKTHLIIKDIHNEFDINWCGKLKDAKPKWVNDKFMFIVRSGETRIELNTMNMSEIERVGKLITKPRGRQAVTEDKARVFLIEEDDKERLMCIITHRKIKTFAPMYDKVGWR
jgi:hypothetical protein